MLSVHLLFLTLFLITYYKPMVEAVLDVSNKIDESLRPSFFSGGTANVLVIMKNSTSPVLQGLSHSFKVNSLKHHEKSSQVYSALKAHTSQSQKPILDILQSTLNTNQFSQNVQSFWIVNQIRVKNADLVTINTLAKIDEVAKIIKEPIGQMRNVLHSRNNKVKNVQWALQQMRVPEVWSMSNGGFNGTGLIVGNIDTGVRGTHELLRNKWLGSKGGWYDPENKTANPHDVYNHGTHTMGTLVGSNGIGIAPGAKWTACKGYRDDGDSTASTFISCGQFMLCPTDTSGNNADCTKTPHMVSNSWGYNPGYEFFNPVIEAWNTAGIVSSFSAGNTGGGNSCSSIYSPADQPVTIIAVGATGRNNELAGFSSLGPSQYGQLKPEICAPGVDIYSASTQSDTAYMSASGTSMSCPNTSGVLALMKAADLNLTNEKARSILQRTANKKVQPSGASCGGVSDRSLPNNHFGHGVVDAFAAVQEVLKKKS